MSRVASCLTLTTTILYSIFGISGASAQLSITTPSNSSVAACEDYSREVLRDAWDFSESTDVPQSIKPLMYQQVSEPMQFSNGVLHLTTTGNDPYFSLLTPIVDGAIAQPKEVKYGFNTPIDVSRYNTFSVRMYVDQPSGFQVYWGEPGTFTISDPVSTKAEWKTYSVDLRSVGINNHGSGNYTWSGSNKSIFRFDPSFLSGSNVYIDWMQLTKSEAECPQFSTSFSGTAGSYTALYIDDDTNFSNGFQQTKVIQNSGSSQSASFSTAKFYPGTYYVYGYETDEFGTLNGNPWDFSSSADVDTSRVYNLSSTNFDGSRYCGTTTSTDGNFYLKFANDGVIDASNFKYLYFKVDVGNASQIFLPNIVWENSSRTTLGQAVATSFDSATGIATFDMTAQSGWSGSIAGLRIQPTKTQGVAFCVDWVAVHTTAKGSPSQPSVPSMTSAPGPITIAAPTTLAIVQPDERGGKDCPTHDLGNPWTFDTQSDVQGLENISNAEFRPYNTVMDSRGGARTGDFLRGISVQGSDDPKVHPILFSNSLDADRCVNLCYSLIINRTYDIYHSVARFTYLSTDGLPQNGDDVINPDRWSQSDVCLYLKDLQQEPVVPPGTTHPWRGKINFLSVDPSEDTDPTEFFLDYVEIREDHKAKDTYAVVVNASLQKTVELFSSTSKPTLAGQLPSGAVSIGSLGAGRTSNVFVWNTSAVSTGRYYISARIDGGTQPIVITSPLPVSVDASFANDTTAPIHIIDSPANGRKVTTTLQIAGAVIDDIRHAVSEVYIDGSYVQAIIPSLYHKGAREQYRSLAPDKPGFNIFVDVSGLSNGSHQFELKSYDTAGNVTTYSTSFTKGATADADYVYPDATAAPISYSTAVQSVIAQVSEGNNVILSAMGYEGCISTAILASKTKDMGAPVTLINGIGSYAKTINNAYQWYSKAKPPSKKKKKCPMKKVCKGKGKKRKCSMKRVCPPAPEDGMLYFQAKCNGASPSNIASLDFKNGVVNPARMTLNETAILADMQSKLVGGQ